MGRIAQLLGVPLRWLDVGEGESPFGGVGRVKESTSRYLEAESDPAERPGWLWEDPRESEEAFRSYIRNVERTARGMVVDPDAVVLKELRLTMIKLTRISAQRAGRAIPLFVQVIENELIEGTFK
jgi:hypothetical protein